MSEQYLTIAEVAELCKVTPETIKDRMRRGMYKVGVHYFRPQGCRPRFKYSAIIAWLEGSDVALESKPSDLKPIPMRRGYLLGGLQSKTK